MRAGIPIGQAQAELNAVAQAIARDNPHSNAGWDMRLTALADYIAGPRTGRTVWMIFGAVALLWVLAAPTWPACRWRAVWRAAMK